MAERIHPVTVPKWGIEMQEGTITEWRVDSGAAVKKGDELIDIETDKIVNTMESPADGVLRRRLVSGGETLKVGELLGVIAAADVADEEIDAFIEGFVPADASFGVGEDLPAAAEGAGESETPSQREKTAGGEAVSGAAPGRVSPVARRLAEQLGVDLAQVKGTGRGGRISREDVQAAADAASGARTDAPASPAAPASGESRMPLSSRALSQARRMVESKQTIPHFYLQRELDMSAVLRLRGESDLPVTAIVVHAMARAMVAEPAVNAHFQNDAVLRPAELGINIAVATDEGLVAPLLGALEGASVEDIARRLKALAERARNRELKSGDLAPGGTTLSNLGMFGIHSFSAIINPPQVAILAVGATRPVQVALEGAPVPAMSATLSCDHRALDGAAGARFLAALQEALLNP